ncbi:hypothetical protein AGLY_003904 [Aphis glycines]|uniref:Uncharacterized protein n=1 Tax=Aphis glycines TaxID=307491 RepID=A0A6G0TWJ0_APHGL|nr:hypothetical protein AGLY_003904 [Aphis glycines]
MYFEYRTRKRLLIGSASCERRKNTRVENRGKTSDLSFPPRLVDLHAGPAPVGQSSPYNHRLRCRCRFQHGLANVAPTVLHRRRRRRRRRWPYRRRRTDVVGDHHHEAGVASPGCGQYRDGQQQQSPPPPPSTLPGGRRLSVAPPAPAASAAGVTAARDRSRSLCVERLGLATLLHPAAIPVRELNRRRASSAL